MTEPGTIETFVPDYKHKCEVCEQKPVVTGVTLGKVVYRSGMCGPCTFGSADAIDPEDW